MMNKVEQTSRFVRWVTPVLDVETGEAVQERTKIS